ncbi:MAG: pentapeptide repeat-containing protein [Geminicoccaceae bacterium]
MDHDTRKAGIPIETPSRLPIDQIRIDLPELFKALGEAAVQAKLATITGGASLPNTFTALFDVFDAVERVEKPGTLPWRWVFKSYARALTDLIGEYAEGAKLANGDANQVESLAQLRLEDHELVFDPRCLRNPANLPMIGRLREVTERGLEFIGVKAANDRKAIARRLPAYLGYALSDEWRSDRGRYQPLIDALEDDPLREANELEDDWQAYHAHLIKEFSAPVFEETFGLNEIYVDLRAYWCRHEIQERETRTTKVPVDLKDAILGWLKNPADVDDAIRMIAGGPGSGKSSFAKMIAAEVARGAEPELPTRVLLFPLQRIHFTDSDSIREIIERYLSPKTQPWFRTDPLNQEDFASPDRRLLLIFDGLDELAKEGERSTEITATFLRELQSYLNAENQPNAVSVLAMVLGRTVSVEAHKSELAVDGPKLLELLRLNPDSGASIENEELLEADLRLLWWDNYCQAKEIEDRSFPDQLNDQRIVELSTEPLLLYLIVKDHAYRALGAGDTFNANRLYEQLFSDVLQRRHGGQHPITAMLDARKTFANHAEAELACQELLEAIACAAWYEVGDGRTASLKDVRKVCHREPRSRAKKLLDVLCEQQDEAGALARMVVNFYFRKGQDRGEDDAFEFTHKSFGEYLTARRLIRLVLFIHDGLTNSPTHYDLAKALDDWCAVTRFQPMTPELLRFVVDEIALRDSDDVKSLQGTWGRLFNENIKTGMPVLDASNLRDAEDEGMNAEEALLSLILGCFKRSGERVALDERNDRHDVIRTIHRCFRPTDRLQQRVGCALARVLDLSSADLRSADLRGADLRGADLRGANLSVADLRGANVSDANLSSADLRSADLRGADLRGAYHILPQSVLTARNWHEAVLDHDLRKACEELAAERKRQTKN